MAIRQHPRLMAAGFDVDTASTTSASPRVRCC